MTWKGSFAMALESARTILIHEWVTGGGLAGSALPASWAAEGRAMRRAIAADFACLPGGPVRVIVTSDARLPDDPGPWTIVRIAAGDDPGRLRDLARAADFTVLIAPETSGILASLTRDLEHAGARSTGLDSRRGRAGGRQGSPGRATARALDRHAADPDGRPRRRLAARRHVSGRLEAHRRRRLGGYLLPRRCPKPARRAREMPVAVLQPFVPGTPMSASFLVGHGGRSWPIGVGIQRMAIRDGRFEYRGGTVPAPCRDALPQLKPAVDAIAGLRGFVGVDFIWNAEERRATILEINPRPTTSYVGLSRLLPPGLLARAWLAACEPAAGDTGILAGLAECIHGNHETSSRSRPMVSSLTMTCGVFV